MTEGATPGSSPELERLLRAIKDFAPARLTLARDKAGLDIKELAERIDTTPSAVSQFESGRARPKIETLIRLALALGVPPDFFSGPPLPGIAVEDCHFRSQKSATKKERRRVLAHGTVLKQVADYLTEYVKFPEEQLSDLRTTVDSRAEIEDLAIRVRDYWNLGLGPIDDMLRLLEQQGVLPVEVPGHSRRLDAFSAWIDNKPVVFLTIDKGSSSRRRWDAAHELAHLLMHDAASDDGRVNRENEANAFAGAFLLPAGPFMSECPRSLEWGKLRALKKRWGVSIAAIVRRAFDLDIFSEATYRRAYVILNKLGWRKKEPDEPPMERPTLLKRAVQLLVDQGRPLSRIAKDLRMGEGALRDLLDPSSIEQIALA